MGVDSQHMLQWEKYVGGNHLSQVSWIPNPNLILYVLISLFLNKSINPNVRGNPCLKYFC